MDSEVKVPLTEFVKDIARESAQVVIKEHLTTCAMVPLVNKIDMRVGSLETEMKDFNRKFYMLLGAIVGSGALGGTVGAMIMRLFG